MSTKTYTCNRCKKESVLPMKHCLHCGSREPLSLTAHWRSLTSRPDLQAIPDAISYGFTSHFSLEDRVLGNVTAMQPPLNKVFFSRGLRRLVHLTKEKMWMTGTWDTSKKELVNKKYHSDISELFYLTADEQITPCKL